MFRKGASVIYFGIVLIINLFSNNIYGFIVLKLKYDFYDEYIYQKIDTNGILPNRTKRCINLILQSKLYYSKINIEGNYSALTWYQIQIHVLFVQSSYLE